MTRTLEDIAERIGAQQLFAPRATSGGIHPRAVVDETAILGPDVSVGACAAIGAGTRLGARCRIHAGAVIGSSVTLGADFEIELNPAAPRRQARTGQVSGRHHSCR